MYSIIGFWRKLRKIGQAVQFSGSFRIFSYIYHYYNHIHKNHKNQFIARNTNHLVYIILNALGYNNYYSTCRIQSLWLGIIVLCLLWLIWKLFQYLDSYGGTGNTAKAVLLSAVSNIECRRIMKHERLHNQNKFQPGKGSYNNMIDYLYQSSSMEPSEVDLEIWPGFVRYGDGQRMESQEAQVDDQSENIVNTESEAEFANSMGTIAESDMLNQSVGENLTPPPAPNCS